MFYLKYITSLLAILINVGIFAQLANPIKLKHYSGEHKTPGESVQCIYQDEIGVLWLGTEALGLIKHDGKNHTVYNHDPKDTTTISSSFPVRIQEDLFNNIWVATFNGLNKFNRQTEIFTRYFHSELDTNTISGNILNDLQIDELGLIWVATTNGISVLNPANDNILRLLHNYEYNKPTQHIEINELHLDKNGNLWIGSDLNGLFLLKKEIIHSVLKEWIVTGEIDPELITKNIKNWNNKTDNYTLQSINSFASGSPDSIWIGSQEGLLLFDKSKNKFKKWHFDKPGHHHLNYATYHYLLMDSYNRLWAGTSNYGLIIIDIDTNTYQILDAKHYTYNRLKSNTIREIIECSNGLIWIATKFGGLHYFDKRQLTFPIITKQTAENPGLNDEFALCAIEDKNNNIWIGTKLGGLNKFDRQNNSFTYFKSNRRPGGLNSNRVEAAISDNKDNLWFGTQAGLECVHPDTLKFRLYTDMHIRNLAYTSKNEIWIGTSNGIFRFSVEDRKLAPLETRHNHFFDVQSNIYIKKVFEDSQGILWIGTLSNGLYEYHYDTDSLVAHINNPDNPYSIKGNLIRSIFEDSNNNLWIGTKSDGLNRFDRDNRTFHQINDFKSLPSTTVYFILEDGSGNLWMGTHNGILKYNPASGNYRNFTTNHGLQSMIFEINSYCQTKDGLFLMGGNKGLNIFDPLATQHKPTKSHVIISNFKTLNNTIAKDIFSFQSFVVEKNSNYLSFEFALLDYTNPDENKYAYKLEPFDIDWIESGTRNFAIYTNLTPGKYLFKVLGTSSMEAWDEEQTVEIEIIIPAPFWKKWWFIPLLVLISLAILITVYYLRLLTIRKRELNLKTQVKQRTKELSDAFQKLEEYNRQIANHNRELRLQRDQISRQNLELEIHRQNLELMVADRTKDLEEAKLKAEESDRLKSAFLANMSHEIRTPLNAIMGFIELMDAGQIEADQQKTIHNIIQTNSNSLLQLINDIIDISMIEANQMIIRKQDLNFNEFLSNIKTHYVANHDIKSKDIQLELDIPHPAEKMMINTAPERVRQIYTNLINNAIKFTEHGTITYGYSFNIKENEIVCYVRDTGSGISPENQKLLFTRFLKIEPSQSKIYRGTGLGLSISKNLIELLGGKIWVESEIGNGTCFYFTLPITN